MNMAELGHKTKDELIELTKEMGISDCVGLKKRDIIVRLLQVDAEQNGNTFCSGKNYGQKAH